MNMGAKIQIKLQGIRVGSVTTLWDLLVWRVSETSWVIGHQTININDGGVSLAEAVAKFERLLD